MAPSLRLRPIHRRTRPRNAALGRRHPHRNWTQPLLQRGMAAHRHRSYSRPNNNPQRHLETVVSYLWRLLYLYVRSPPTSPCQHYPSKTLVSRPKRRVKFCQLAIPQLRNLSRTHQHRPHRLENSTVHVSLERRHNTLEYSRATSRYEQHHRSDRSR